MDSSIVETQVRAMLDGIDADLARRRAEILAETEAEAQNMLTEARRRARARMSQAVAQEREHRDHSLRRARAALASRVRRKRQALDKEQLAEGHERLREALVERWREPAARAEWARTLIEEAGRLLPNGRWRVEYPARLDPVEAARLLDSPSGNPSAERIPSEDIQAGFRLRCQDAELDMSVDGLLAQVDEMAGELLAEIHRQQEQQARAE